MALTLESVSILLRGSVLIKPFSLAIAKAETVTLMGPSGAGKSSLMSFIAGDLEAPFKATGRVTLDGLPLDGTPPERRNVGRLFQDDLLFPHLTVGENLLFGLPRRRYPERRAAMQRALADAELAGMEDRPPHTLSGGQRARVALMRALLAEPAAMLLDEPFNKLDQELRDAMRGFVFDHLRERKVPCLMVTHDRQDAPAGGRVLMLTRNGEVRNA